MNTTRLLLILLVYLILFFDIQIDWVKSGKRTSIQYTGLCWVGLDYWSINRFKSQDEPLKWIDIKTD